MHNVILNESAGLKVRVRWLRGQMKPTQPDVNPSFDDPKSFSLDIEAGAVGISPSDLTAVLNSGLLKGSPLQNVSLTPYAKQMKLRGTLHEGVLLPIEIISGTRMTLTSAEVCQLRRSPMTPDRRQPSIASLTRY